MKTSPTVHNNNVANAHLRRVALSYGSERPRLFSVDGGRCEVVLLRADLVRHIGLNTRNKVHSDTRFEHCWLFNMGIVGNPVGIGCREYSARIALQQLSLYMQWRTQV